MSFKTILAVVEMTDGLEGRLRNTVDFVRSCEAHLSILLVGQATQLPFYGYGGEGYSKIWVTESEARAAALRTASAEIERFLMQEGVSFDVRAHQAIIQREDNLVARHAMYSDLTVIIRSVGDTRSTVERQAIDGALFDSGRPILYLPDPSGLDVIGKRILVAWNSRAEAAEALSDALPILKNANDVTLLIVDPIVGPDDHGEDPGSDMALVLARHDINVEVRSVEAAGRLTSTVLQDEAKRLQADLIVMGAYGHSRVRQNILGGTTREMLETSDVPLFLAN